MGRTHIQSDGEGELAEVVVPLIAGVNHSYQLEFRWSSPAAAAMRVQMDLIEDPESGAWHRLKPSIILVATYASDGTRVGIGVGGENVGTNVPGAAINGPSGRTTVEGTLRVDDGFWANQDLEPFGSPILHIAMVATAGATFEITGWVDGEAHVAYQRLQSRLIAPADMGAGTTVYGGPLVASEATWIGGQDIPRPAIWSSYLPTDARSIQAASIQPPASDPLPLNDGAWADMTNEEGEWTLRLNQAVSEGQRDAPMLMIASIPESMRTGSDPP